MALAFLVAAPVSRGETPAAETRFNFIYQVRIDSIPPGAGEIKIWVPLARSDDYQKILNLEVLSPVEYEIHEDPDYGNKILFLKLERPRTETLTFDIRYNVEVRGEKRTFSDLSQRRHEDGAAGPGKKELFLASQSLLVIDGRIKEIAADVTRGKNTDLEKAKAIYDYVIQTMKYDKSGQGWGRGSTVYACEVRKGNCTDFHSLFIALARASGVPARFKIGAQIPGDQPEGTVGYHCWAEFYLPEEGWVPVDASEAWKHPELKEFYFGSHDSRKFFINLGRDISLTPAAKGNPVNIFIHPYVELDGKPFNAAGSQFTFKIT
ncbi:MAG: transglutaminase domain-containing protein [Candidatus Omnitrophica bacterium]|nr:transglutaminase domain-containing protein [Candidatus Omnitrophota bacterium]